MRSCIVFFVCVCAVVLWALPQHAFAALAQNAYRFYVNTDGTTPTDPWPAGGTDLGENTAIAGTDSPPKVGDIVRMRLSANVTGETQASGLTVKLQYGVGATCSAIGTWNDVGAAGSGVIWRGFDNATPADDATLPSVLLAPSDIVESYEEQNNSVATPNAIGVGQDGEWDWVVQNNGALRATTYCFRMVKSDGTALDSYTDYPKITTYSYVPKSQNWRWYDDENTATPAVSLGTENQQIIGVRDGNTIKLRYTLKETNGVAGSNVKMKVQYSTSSTFASDVNDVVETGSCNGSSRWCYGDGVDADNAGIEARVLTDGTANATHNESGTSSSTYTHAANTASEWEFTIKNSGAIAGTVYYFRAYDLSGNDAVPLNSGETYPSLKVFNTILAFSVAGIGSGVTTEGITTTRASTATTLPFGTLIPNQVQMLAHRLTVTADGLGYRVTVQADGPLRTAGGEYINEVSGTNALPAPWGYSITQTIRSAFGYHAGDDVLSGGSTRFQSNDTWAQLETTARDIMYTSGPVENDIHDIVYKLEASAIQPAGTYSQEILYIVVPEY